MNNTSASAGNETKSITDDSLAVGDSSWFRATLLTLCSSPLFIFNIAFAMLSFVILWKGRKTVYKDAIFMYWKVYFVLSAVRNSEKLIISVRAIFFLLFSCDVVSTGNCAYDSPLQVFISFLGLTLWFPTIALNLLNVSVCLYQAVVLFAPKYYYFKSKTPEWKKFNKCVISVCVALSVFYGCFLILLVYTIFFSDRNRSYSMASLIFILSVIIMVLFALCFIFYVILMVIVLCRTKQINTTNKIERSTRRVLWIGIISLCVTLVTSTVTHGNKFFGVGFYSTNLRVLTEVVNYGIDPFLHLWKNSQFRSDAKQMFRKVWPVNRGSSKSTDP